MDEIKYIEGFNDGWLLGKHKLEIANEIGKGIKSTEPYYEGLVAGTIEIEIERRQKQLGNLRDRGRDADLER